MKKLIDKMVPTQERYWSLGSQQILADHFNVLRNGDGLQYLPVNNHQSYKYEGDFWGLLKDLGVNEQYHALVTFFNGYSHPADYKGTPGNVVLPNLQTCETILRLNGSQSF